MIYTDEIAQKIASELLQIKAIKLQPNDPFQWSSGWLSPIYCDNRLTLSYPPLRKYIKKALCEVVKSKFNNATLIAGVATAGIPHGALIADELNLPYAYVRPEPKKHGMGNQIEGRVEPNSKIVIIEDLISTGGSSLKTVKPLEDTNSEVIGAIAIFDYGFQTALDNFSNANLPYYTLSNYDHLIQAAIKDGYIEKEDVESLKNWRQKPQEWKEMPIQ